MTEVWNLSESATTDKAHGKAPEDRDVEELLAAGMILLDKPHGPTSHQVASWVRDIFGLEKMGHGGTLDPFATGVLPLLAGKSMRLTKEILAHGKTYIAVLRFTSEPAEDELQSAIARLSGRIYNVPPAISAVKVQVRTRKIEGFELIELTGRVAAVRITCEAGTYVRTLARDMGLLLDQQVELIELRRSISGRFDEDSCVSLDQVADAIWLWKSKDDPAALLAILHPLEELLAELPAIVVKDAAVGAISHGATLNRPGIVTAPKGLTAGTNVRVMTLKGEIAAIAELLVDSDRLPAMETGEVTKSLTVLMDTDVYPRAWKAEES